MNELKAFLIFFKLIFAHFLSIFPNLCLPPPPRTTPLKDGWIIHFTLFLTLDFLSRVI